MNEYIATFFSHFGAVRFHKLLKSANLTAELVPVPRSLSSSCGTAVHFFADSPKADGAHWDEIEQITLVKEDSYMPIYHAEDGKWKQMSN